MRMVLEQLVASGRLLEGEFLPEGHGREWCDTQVLRLLKRRSLARLRRQVEPVEPAALARFLPQWQGILRPRRGLDGLLDVLQQLQGLPLPASVWELEILPGRLAGYRPADLDELCASGEVVWRGFESLGSDDGRIALYLTDHLLPLAPPPTTADHPLAAAVRAELARGGAVFFDDLARRVGGFRHDVLDTLWQMVWAGEVTNDTLAPVRSLRRQRRAAQVQRAPSHGRGFRSRRSTALPGSEGRWSLLLRHDTTPPSVTERQAALAAQLIDRYGVLTREMISAEGIRGGFAGIYPVLKAMEEAGKLRRGYFVAGLGAAQFAAPGAEDRLRDPQASARQKRVHSCWRQPIRPTPTVPHCPGRQRPTRRRVPNGPQALE